MSKSEHIILRRYQIIFNRIKHIIRNIMIIWNINTEKNNLFFSGIELKIPPLPCVILQKTADFQSAAVKPPGAGRRSADAAFLHVGGPGSACRTGPSILHPAACRCRNRRFPSREFHRGRKPAAGRRPDDRASPEAGQDIQGLCRLWKEDRCLR